MLTCVDVHYRADGAIAACVLFRDWNDSIPAAEHTARVQHVAEYIPGEFWRRELPCILEVLKLVSQPLDVIIVDGYVWLEPGRGANGRAGDGKQVVRWPGMSQKMGQCRWN